MIEDNRPLDFLPLVQRQLFALIRLACGLPIDACLNVCKIDWQALYQEAEKQSLVGICWSGIERLPKDRLPDMDMLMEWLGQAEYIKTRNAEINKRAVELQSRVKSQGLKSSVLKGCGVAQLYDSGSSSSRSSNGLSQLRTSGDIDLWIDGSREEILKFAESQGKIERIVYHNVEVEVFPDVAVELHFTPSWLCNYFRNRQMQKWFNESFDECYENKVRLPNAGEVSVPTLRFNRVFILQHIYRHLFGDGIGLRQLLDYYFVLVKSQESDGERFWAQEKIETMEVLRQLGMAKFTSATMWVLEHVFGLPDDYKLCPANEKEGRFLLSEIMQAGNFGHYDERIVHPENENKLHSFFRITKQNLRFIKHYPNEVLWNPVFRAWHYLWRKYKGYKV